MSIGQADPTPEPQEHPRGAGPPRRGIPAEGRELPLPSAEAEAIDEVLEGVIDDPEERTRVSRVLSLTVQRFRSPYIPPEYLERYEAVVPGLARQIVDQANAQTAHRQELERTVVSGAERRADRGQNFGLIIALAFLVATVILGLGGQPWLAGVLGSIDLVALVAVFVLGKQKQEARAQAPDPPVENLGSR